jgi:hypothetical protein
MGNTGVASRTGVVFLCFVLASIPALAQSHQFGVIGIGSFSRVGSVPQAFAPGMPVAIEASVQWPFLGPVEIATSADLTIQKIGTLTSVLSPTGPEIVSRPFSFDVVHFGLGLGFTRDRGSRVRISGSAQGLLLVPGWNSASVGICGADCAVLTPSARDQQTEVHLGGAGRLRLTYGKQGNRMGIEMLGIVGPHHTASRLPLSTVALMLVVGGT